MGSDNKGSMETVIENGVMGIRSTTDILAKLLRIVVHNQAMTPSRWSSLANRYSKKMAKLSSDKKLSDRNNLDRALAKDTMSFKTFIRGMDVLDADEVTFQVLVTRGDVTKVSSLVITNDDIMKEHLSPDA